MSQQIYENLINVKEKLFRYTLILQIFKNTI